MDRVSRVWSPRNSESETGQMYGRILILGWHIFAGTVCDVSSAQTTGQKDSEVISFIARLFTFDNNSD